MIEQFGMSRPLLDIPTSNRLCGRCHGYLPVVIRAGARVLWQTGVVAPCVGGELPSHTRLRAGEFLCAADGGAYRFGPAADGDVVLLRRSQLLGNAGVTGSETRATVLFDRYARAAETVRPLRGVLARAAQAQ